MMKDEATIQTELNANMTTEEEDLFDQQYMHIYRTMHALFHVEIEDGSAYTQEELDIEGV